MLSPAASSALFVVVVGLHAPRPVEECWKGSTTNGSNPGLNTMMLCVAANDAVELRVYFPNTPIQEPPTTCRARGRRSDVQGSTFRIETQVGQCENGSTMGQYDLRCVIDAQRTISCTFPAASGNLVNVVLEKIFP